MKNWAGKTERRIESISVFIVAIIFIILGLTKIAGHSENEAITSLIPSIAGAGSLFWLGIIELVGGGAMLVNRFKHVAFTLFTVYLALLLFILFTEYSTLVTQNIFKFSVVGDKLVRTIGLIASALVVLNNSHND